MSRKITFGLSENEIDRAIRELEQYKQELIQKCNILQDEIANRLMELAQVGFSTAVADDITEGGSPRRANVQVSVDNRGTTTVVIARGEDAVWVEFGAGVYHNTSPGTSPHPSGAELGMLIGEYGKGYGRKKAWGYYDSDGKLVITRGTPASMPMYRSMMTVINEIPKIAKEVFR